MNRLSSCKKFKYIECKLLNMVDWIRVIAAYEMIGGAIGVALTIFLTVAYFALVPSMAIIGFIFLLLFLLSCYAGYLLWKDEPNGFNFSLIIQALQIFQFKIPGILAYSFVAGIKLPLIFEFDILNAKSSFETSIGFTSSFNFTIGPEDKVFLFGLNVVAVAALLYLFNARQKRKAIMTQKENVVQPVLPEEADKAKE